MSRINTNVTSLIAQRVLKKNNDQLNTSLERLSTGLKINKGADNPAGLIARGDGHFAYGPASGSPVFVEAGQGGIAAAGVADGELGDHQRQHHSRQYRDTADRQ